MARGAIFRTARGAIFRMALSVPWGDEAPKRARLARMKTIATSLLPVLALLFAASAYFKSHLPALAWLEAGRLKVKDWQTKIPLADAPAWFERITANPNEKGAFKLVVDPWEGRD